MSTPAPESQMKQGKMKRLAKYQQKRQLRLQVAVRTGPSAWPEAKTPKTDSPATSKLSPKDLQLWSSGPQRFAVVRHAERSDASFEDPNSPGEFRFDPSLSSKGKEQARELGERLAELGGFRKVVCSPFMRCVQTALPICEALRCPLLIDQVWGEMRSPKIFGEDPPENVTRSMDVLVKLASDRGVRVRNAGQLVGSPPAFPEHARAARERYDRRFKAYLERSQRTQSGFVVVTHGQAIPACLPDDFACHVAEVPFASYFAGEVQESGELKLLDDTLTWYNDRPYSVGLDATLVSTVSTRWSTDDSGSNDESTPSSTQARDRIGPNLLKLARDVTGAMQPIEESPTPVPPAGSPV